MNKKIILLSALALVSIVALSQTAYAATATLSVVPATSSKSVGTSFNATVSLVPQGEKVCVVSGTLTFSNLTCKSITVDSSVMAQSVPTCANPKFVLGIPGCTNSSKSLLSVSVKGNAPGQGVLFFSGAKVIGAGTDVAFEPIGGLYNIMALPKPAPVQENTAVEQPTQEEIQTPVEEQPATENNIPEDVGAASFLTVASKYFWPILIILVIAVIVYGIFYFVRKKKEKKPVENNSDNSTNV